MIRDSSRDATGGKGVGWRPRRGRRWAAAMVVLGTALAATAGMFGASAAGESAGATAIASTDGAARAAGSAREPDEEALYVQNAQRGSLTRLSRRGTARLRLRGVSRSVLLFIDRPERFAHQLPMRRFVGQWGRTFGRDAPNAALDVLGDRAQRGVAVELLGRPRYRPKSRALVYRVRRLQRGRRARALFGKRLRDPSLFIDGGEVEYVVEATVKTSSGTITGSVPVEPYDGGVDVEIREGQDRKIGFKVSTRGSNQLEVFNQYPAVVEVTVFVAGAQIAHNPLWPNASVSYKLPFRGLDPS